MTARRPIWCGFRSGCWSARARATRAATPTSGLWADEDAVAAWLQRDFTTELFTALLPEAAPFRVSRYAPPNLRALNFVVHGFPRLGRGVEPAPRHPGEGPGGAAARAPGERARGAGRGGEAGRAAGIVTSGTTDDDLAGPRPGGPGPVPGRDLAG